MTYRSTPGACLACATPLERVGRRLVCSACRSALVPAGDVNAAMRAMWPEGETPRLPSIGACAPGTRVPRPCPQCDAPMCPCMFLLIPLDRCDAHGIWFDRDELERVLFAAAPRKPEPELGVIRGALGVVGVALELFGALLQLLAFF